MLLPVYLASLVYVWLLLDRGWVPHDEGTLAQSALRVLQGELPHRDFEEIYTGGLTYLNALAFEIWGVRLPALRYMAYLFFACWIPVVYYLASRWARPPAAGLLTAAAVAWSYPNYTAAMPSWYMLYCTTGTLACLARYLEVRRRGWLVAAGALAGVACLFKIAGLYTIAGSLLFLVYLEQRHAPPAGARSRGYPFVTGAGLLAFAAGVYLLARPRLGVQEFIQFVLPSCTAVAFLLAHEWRTPRSHDARRFTALLGLVAPFVAGVAIPLVATAAFFAAQGGLDDLLAGVLIKPFRRLETAARRPPVAGAILASLIVAGLLVLERRLRGASSRRAVLLLGGMAGGMLALGGVPGIGQLGYLTLSQSVPVVVGLSTLLLWHEARTREHVALLAFMCATYTLVQYPFSTPTYFTYIAPVVILGAAAAAAGRAGALGPGLALLLVLYTCYAALWVTPRQLQVHNSRGLLQDDEVRTLLPGLADLKLSPTHWHEYETLVPLVAGKASGDYIFAGPDSPEVYFLSGNRNPTRSLFDFFDEQHGRSARILETLERRGVRVVVINRYPLFSAPFDSGLLRALSDRYPHDSIVGRFTVRWN